MENELTALFGFLGRFGVEVEGRQSSVPEDEVAEKLIRFAKGECAPEERGEVCEILRANPAWLRWLADKVKLGRTEGLKRDTAAW